MDCVADGFSPSRHDALGPRGVCVTKPTASLFARDVHLSRCGCFPWASHVVGMAAGENRLAQAGASVVIPMAWVVVGCLSLLGISLVMGANLRGVPWDPWEGPWICESPETVSQPPQGPRQKVVANDPLPNYRILIKPRKHSPVLSKYVQPCPVEHRHHYSG